MGLVRLNGVNGRFLRNAAQEVTDPVKEIEPYIDEAYAILAREEAIGIAATQIGLPYRWYISPNQGLVINPAITKSEGKVSIIEGCLSIPERWFEVERSKVVTVVYQDLDLNIITKDFTDYEAYVAQHEIDHLDGILIQDHGVRKYAGE